MDEADPKPNVHRNDPDPVADPAEPSTDADPRHSGPSEDATADIVERQKGAKTGRAPEDAPDY